MSSADDRAGDGEEGFVDGSEAFESNAQMPEVMQPGMGSFDDPAGFANTAAMKYPADGGRQRHQPEKIQRAF